MDLLPTTQSATLDSPLERRATRRFDMRLPATVKATGSTPVCEVLTETQNISARGVFLYLDRAVTPGETLEVTLTFPPHITLADAVRIRFVARVLRVDTAPLSRVGVAALIEEYEFLRSNSATGHAEDLRNTN